MKKIIAWLLVLAMTAAISIGATLAYLTDTDEDVNVMTVGNVKIDQLEYERVDDETSGKDAEVREFHDNKPLYPAVTDNDFDYTPGDANVDWTQIGKDGYTSEIWNPEDINNELDKMVFVKNKGTYDAFVRTIFAFEAGNYTTLDEFNAKMHLNLNTTDWTWQWEETPVEIPNAEGGTTKYFIATATYNKALAPNALTEISLSQIALDKTATNADVEAFGEAYHILVKSQAIQAEGFGTAEAALDEGFGLVSENIPFEIDAPVVGADVQNALHYLNADPAGTKITSKVTNVVYGLTKDYPEIANQYDGLLVTDGQDVPVYTYYVPNGSNYDVYMLSNGEIYLPQDSSRLFQEMSSLVSVDTSNLNTSRVELMNHMFYKCSALKEVDVSGFDMQNVTTVKSMFNLCSVLTGVDVSDWNTPNLTDISYMFYKTYVIGDLDLTGLDTGKVQNMAYMFAYCNNTTVIDASGWDLSSLTNMEGAFGMCPMLEKINGTGWNPVNLTNGRMVFYNAYKLNEIIGSGDWVMPKVTDLYCMFQNCDSLKVVDVTSWDLSSVQNMYSMFWNCDILETIEGCENWNTGSVTNMMAMFEKSHKLKDVDVSTWDTSSVTDMSHMFRAEGLEYLDVSNWDVSNVLYFNSMFSASTSNTGAISLKELDLSKWNPKSAVTMNNMFQGCSQLTELDLSGWDLPNMTTTSHMFSDCFNLKSVDLSGWNTPALTSMDGMFNDCRSLTVVDVSDLDTALCVEFSQIFEACHSLVEIIGLDKWDTSKGIAFDEMFNQAWSLKELDLSSFDTSGAKNYGVMQNGGIYYGYSSMFSGMGSLQKLTLGENFVFAGNGSIQPSGYPSFPNPAAIDGQAAKWYNAETDTYYAPSEIPEKTAATYIAAVPPANP